LVHRQNLKKKIPSYPIELQLVHRQNPRQGRAVVVLSVFVDAPESQVLDLETTPSIMEEAAFVRAEPSEAGYNADFQPFVYDDLPDTNAADSKGIKIGMGLNLANLVLLMRDVTVEVSYYCVKLCRRYIIVDVLLVIITCYTRPSPC
jgi:hypothetical protein